MRVFIHQSDLMGHRSHYASLLVSALLELDVSVFLATKESSLSHSLTQHHLGKLLGQIEVFPLAEEVSEIQRLKATVEDGRPDHLLVPTADPLMMPIFLQTIKRKTRSLKSVFSEALFFGPGYGYQQDRLIRRIANPFRRSFVMPRLPWNVISHVDPYQCDALNARGSQICQLRPDPAPVPRSTDKGLARAKLNLPTEGRLVGCSGAISVDKGIIELIDAFASLVTRATFDDTCLLLAGKFEHTVEKYLSQHHQKLVDTGRLICINRHLDEDEMQSVFVALDLVVAAHRGRPGSSGIVLRAAASKTPVLARDKYWTQKIVPEFDLGWTCKTWIPTEFEAGLGKCLEVIGSYRQSEKAAKYVQFQSEDNFRAHWTQEIRLRMGVEPDPGLVSWDSVRQKNRIKKS